MTDDFEVDGTTYRREGPFDDIFQELRAEGVKALMRPQRKPRKPRKPRKRSLTSLLKEAEEAGRPVSSAVIDGVELRFGEPEPTITTNPWLDDLKVTKQ